VRTVETVEQLRWQQHGSRLRVAFWRQGQGEVRRFQGFEQVQTHMTVAQLMAGQRRRQQYQRVGLRVEFVQKADEGFVQRAQPAALDPTFQQLQQVGGLTQGGQRLQR